LGLREKVYSQQFTDEAERRKTAPLIQSRTDSREKQRKELAGDLGRFAGHQREEEGEEEEHAEDAEGTENLVEADAVTHNALEGSVSEVNGAQIVEHVGEHSANADGESGAHGDEQKSRTAVHGSMDLVYRIRRTSKEERITRRGVPVGSGKECSAEEKELGRKAGKEPRTGEPRTFRVHAQSG
jgi:hypothetical protein